MSVFTKSAPPPPDSTRNKKESIQLSCAKLQSESLNESSDLSPSYDEIEILITSNTEDSDCWTYLEEITDVMTEETTENNDLQTSTEETFDWELFVESFLRSDSEPLDVSQDEGMAPLFSSTKMEDIIELEDYDEKIEEDGSKGSISLYEEISEVFGDWCYQMEKRMLEVEYSVVRQLQSNREQIKSILEGFKDW